VGSHPRNLIWAPIGNFVQIRRVGSISAFSIGMAGQVAIGIGALLGRWWNLEAGESMQTFTIITTPNELCTLNGSAKRTRMPTLLPTICREPVSINRVSARRQDFSALILRVRVFRSRKRRNRQHYQMLRIHQNPGEVSNHVARLNGWIYLREY
jgi:hypothetical protein